MSLKKTICLIYGIVFFISAPLNALATTVGAHNFPFLVDDVVSHVSKIDLTSGRVTGEKTQFYFVLPNTWNDYITADRENNLSGNMILEQINFYCGSVSGLYKPQLLFSLYVMDKRFWTESSNYQPVMKSKDYVFAVKYGTNGFTLKGDSAIYKSKLDAVANVSLVKKCIQLPVGQQEAYELTAFVDGTPVYHKVELIDNVYYVNLRDVCVALGYKIEWLPSSSSVFVHSNDFDDIFKVNAAKGTDSRGIKMRVINNMTYVSTAYFFRIMKKDIEIDKQKNIYIFSK